MTLLLQPALPLTACLVAAADLCTKYRAVRARRFARTQFDWSVTGGNAWVLVLLWCVAVAGIVAGIQSGAVFQRSVAQVGLGAGLGGSFSNLYGLVRRGAVTDFLKLGSGPIFNLADAGITIGAIVALWFH